ncbi:MAG: transketolase [Firmicutes bacterium HGW-Firmicutes-7]|nr:MAG: transketolase [Firmicutes bacterium HGW-Firmicutes-7]
MLSIERKEYLEKKARVIRKDIIEMIYNAQSGHPGGSYSLADVMAVLYFHDLNVDPKNPKGLNRDRVVLSKGHAAPVWYATLAEAGFFPKEELSHLRQINSLLQGHPCINIPGVDITTGSLGLGLSASCGIAIGAKMTGRDNVRVYAIIGDGEQGEGQIWEAAMAAAHFKLDNLTAILDRNWYQNDGPTETSLKLEPLHDKWESFGWNVIDIDGHNLNQIDSAFCMARETKNKPTMIIANTVKGKGTSYMLDQPGLHYTPPTKEQMELTLKELGF